MGFWDRVKGAIRPARASAREAAPPTGGAPAACATVPATCRTARAASARQDPLHALVPWRGGVRHRPRDFEQRNGIWQRRDIAAQLIWQADDAERVVANAEIGDMRPLALFVDALRSDDTVGATMDHLLSMLRLPISWDGDPLLIQQLKGTNPTFDAASGVELDPGVLGDFWRAAPMSELREVMWDGRIAGLGLGEFVPQPEGPPRLRHLDLHNVRLDWATETLYYHSMGDTYEIRPGDGRWFVFLPYGELRFWRKAPWRRCFDPYVQKKKARLYRLRKMGDMANALHVVIANPQRTGRELDDLELFASDYWDNDSYLILESEEDAKIVEAQGQGWQAFDSGEDRADKALARALSGQIVTSTGTTGMNNAGGIWENIARGIIEEQADRLADTVHEQLFRPYARERGRAGAVWIKWDVRSPQQKVAEAEALGKVAESIEKADRVFAARKVRVDVASYLEDNGVAVRLEAITAPPPLQPAPPALQPPLVPDPLLGFSALQLAATAGAEEPWHGLPILVEYRPGDVRSGHGPDGELWAVVMGCGYGSINGTRGADGEPADVYLGPDDRSPTAFLVEQLHPDGTFDELKVLLGWHSADAALEAYLSHVPPWCFGGLAQVDIADLLSVVTSAAVALAGDEGDAETPVGSGR